MLNVDGHHVQNRADVRERIEHREELAVVLRIWLFGKLQLHTSQKTNCLIFFAIKNPTNDVQSSNIQYSV